MKYAQPSSMFLAMSLCAVLTGCGGGSDRSASADVDAAPDAGNSSSKSVVQVTQALRVAVSTPAAPPAVVPAAAPSLYLRTVYVDGLAAAASDTGLGTLSQPYKTIGAAMRKLQPGDDVVIAPGTYREGIAVPTLTWGTALTRIRAQTAHTTLIKGSVEVAGWTAGPGGTYWVHWPGDEPQQIYRDGVPLKQIGGTVFGGYPNDPNNSLAHAHEAEGGIWPGRVAGGVNDLVAESFTYDAAAHRLVVKSAIAILPGQVLEVSSVRQPLQAEEAENLTVEGLDFAHSNTSIISRWGAVKVSGTNNALNDLVVSDMDAACVQLSGSNSTLTNSTIQRCGQIGISGGGTRLTIANNRVTYANTRGFNKWWEAGGMKLMSVSGLHASTIRNNVVAYNLGDGIWIDWKNADNLIEGNTAAYNTGFGIQYEASKSATIRSNRVYGNGLRGIYLLESSDSVVSGNAVFGNVMEGIAIVNGERSGADATLLPVNNTVTGNSVGWNDFNRNWVQLVVPDLIYGTVSNNNTFKAELLLPRMSVGFMGMNNPAYPTLASWVAASQQDRSSTEQLVTMPTDMKAGLAARRLMSTTELPTFLTAPGTF